MMHLTVGPEARIAMNGQSVDLDRADDWRALFRSAGVNSAQICGRGSVADGQHDLAVTLPRLGTVTGKFNVLSGHNLVSLQSAGPLIFHAE
jgi:hypothetical protein